MKLFAKAVIFMALSQSAFSMPCDTGYDCASKTGKYKISLQRCRYRNHLNLISTKINDIEVAGAALNEGWDGDLVLAFEVNIPTGDDSSVRILTAELSGKHKVGIVKEKFAATQPSPLTIVRSEKIACTVAR